MKHFFLFLGLWTWGLGLGTSFSQDALKYLRIKGTVMENNENTLEGAKAIIYKNSVKIDEQYTSKDGKFSFTLELNQRYLIEVTKPYYITKRISFSTTIPPDIKVIYPYKFTINIFKSIEGIDYSVLNDPIGHVKYYSDANKFDYDEAYTNSIKEKLEKLYEQIAQKEAAQTQKTQVQSPKSKVQSPKSQEPSTKTQDPSSRTQGTRPNLQDRSTEPVISAKLEEEKESKSKETDMVRKSEGEIIYKLQIATFTKPVPPVAENFNGLEGVKVYFENGLYKYTFGETTDYKYASTVLKESVRNSGFKNAFVVSFKDDKRISEKYKDENISAKSSVPGIENKEILPEEKVDAKIKPENADSRPSPAEAGFGLRRQEKETEEFLSRKNAEFEAKTLTKQMETEREMAQIQEIKDKLNKANSRKIFLEEIAGSKRTMKKSAENPE